MLKLYTVYANNGESRVGTYYAKNEKAAIQRAKDDQMSQGAVFKNGGIHLKDCTAILKSQSL